ncbi:MAG: hypothetical protein ACFB15_18215 [Cyclobacteriaceae bacterium]
MKFRRVKKKWWAMLQMWKAHLPLQSVPGLSFYKLLGSGGGNGFSILPDLSTYALLAVWEDKPSAVAFFQSHPYSQQVFVNAQHSWTIFMNTARVKGSWENGQPFPEQKADVANGPVAVLTRATIHPAKLWSFWKHVPKVSNRLEHHQTGIVFSKGIGEVPLLQQATFSLWKNREAMVAYAYRSAKHREMIKKTRELEWYREELFAEFVLTDAKGQWPDIPDLSHYLNHPSSTEYKRAV